MTYTPPAIRLKIEADLTALRRQLARYGYRPTPMALDGWLAPRRSPLIHVERSRGYVAHVWVGALGLHLAWPPHHSRLDFCADWWR